MIKLSRDMVWYRPYTYDKYVIDTIKFYDNSGVIIETSQGWLECKHKDLECIYLDIDEIKLKRKEDFTIKGAFIISKGQEPYGSDLKADLYINKDIVNLKFKEYIKEYNSIRKYYMGTDDCNQNFELSESVKWLQDKYYNYQAQIEQIGKKLSLIYQDTTENEFNNYIKELKKYGKKMFQEKERINNYTVEDYLKEIGSEGK